MAHRQFLPQLGIDLGGTKISGCVLDSDGKMLFQKRVATPAGDYCATVSSVIDLVHEAEASIQHVCSVGVGTPGSASPGSGAMRNCNSTCLNGQQLQEDIESVLGRDVVVANDANCFALSEALDGSAAGFDCVLGLIIGTGVGAGIVINGQLLEGKNSIAGEWGHNYFPPAATRSETRSCYCGKQDCIETWLSGPGLQRSYAQRSGEVGFAAEQIVQLALRGDASAAETLAQYEADLATALSTVVNVLDPDAIILGGGVGQIPDLAQNLADPLSQKVFSDYFTTPILMPKFGADSGVRGAARLNRAKC